MRRKRYQRGSLKRTTGKPRKWVAQWWEAGSRRNRTLGLVSDLTRAQAETILAAIVKPINEGLPSVNTKPVRTVSDFVENVYVPFKLGAGWNKQDSTPVTALWEIRRQILPAIGSKFLQSVSRDELQAFLNLKAPMLSKSVVGHLRWHLNGIFRLAVSDGILQNNPAAELYVPKECKPGRQVRSLAEDEVEAYLGVLEDRERLMARLAIFEGMRPGESSP